MGRTSRHEAPENPLWHIALYIRLSRDDGNDESLSVINQKKILTEYVTRFFPDQYAIADYYVDDGRSGTDYDRPDFQRMIHDMEQKKVNCIICKNLARAFRNYADQGYFLERVFPLHGIRFITLGDPQIDTFLNPEAVSGMEVPISGLMNDRFAYATSSSVRKTFDTKRRNGEFIGAFAPYGYKKCPADKNTLVIDEEAAQVVRAVFHWFVFGDNAVPAGLSKESIARKLNEMGVPNPTRYKETQGLRYRNPHANKNDGLWMGASVARLLKNKVYIGTMVQGRQRVISYKVHNTINMKESQWYQVPQTHQPIVSPALFEQAQALHQQDIRVPPGHRGHHLFSGLLICADCGKAMTRRASNGYVYYNCSTYKRKSKTKCTRHTIRLDRLEQAVLGTIQTQIALIQNPDALAESIRQADSTEKNSISLAHLLQRRQQELEKTGALISGLYLDWKNGDITREQYHKLKLTFEQQEHQSKEAIAHIQRECSQREDNPGPHAPYLDAFLQHKNISSLSQGILLTLVEAIQIHEGGGISIRFQFQDPYKCFLDTWE